MKSIEFQISEKLEQYYKNYYQKELGLPDYEIRVQNRLKEDDTYEALAPNGDIYIMLPQEDYTNFFKITNNW